MNCCSGLKAFDGPHGEYGPNKFYRLIIEIQNHTQLCKSFASQNQIICRLVCFGWHIDYVWPQRHNFRIIEVWKVHIDSTHLCCCKGAA